MPSQKTFRTKVKLAKAQRQNRYVFPNTVSRSGSSNVVMESEQQHFVDHSVVDVSSRLLRIARQLDRSRTTT